MINIYIFYLLKNITSSSVAFYWYLLSLILHITYNINFYSTKTKLCVVINIRTITNKELLGKYFLKQSNDICAFQQIQFFLGTSKENLCFNVFIKSMMNV